MKKLNNKGFTLIELLAVIVILAIVMGVAANAVLNVMNDSRKKTLESSAKSAADAFRTAYAEYQVTNTGPILGIPADTLITNGEAHHDLQLSATYLGISTNNYQLDKSFVSYNGSKSTFAVCLVAATTGNYYLATARGNALDVENSPVGVAMSSDDMWACSDGSHSWN